MPHTVWNLGVQAASARLLPRQFVAGIEPAQAVFIGRAREPKNMIVLLDAWVEFNDLVEADVVDDLEGANVSLALGKDPLNTALLLPVATIICANGGAANRFGAFQIEPTFRAQGTMWAAKQIAIDLGFIGTIDSIDVDVHLDWTVAGVDWWTWFIGWNRLEVTPDGSLTDGERAYA